MYSALRCEAVIRIVLNIAVLLVSIINIGYFVYDPKVITKRLLERIDVTLIDEDEKMTLLGF